MSSLLKDSPFVDTSHIQRESSVSDIITNNSYQSQVRKPTRFLDSQTKHYSSQITQSASLIHTQLYNEPLIGMNQCVRNAKKTLGETSTWKDLIDSFSREQWKIQKKQRETQKNESNSNNIAESEDFPDVPPTLTKLQKLSSEWIPWGDLNHDIHVFSNELKAGNKILSKSIQKWLIFIKSIQNPVEEESIEENIKVIEEKNEKEVEKEDENTDVIEEVVELTYSSQIEQKIEKPINQSTEQTNQELSVNNVTIDQIDTKEETQDFIRNNSNVETTENEEPAVYEDINLETKKLIINETQESISNDLLEIETDNKVNEEVLEKPIVTIEISEQNSDFTNVQPTDITNSIIEEEANMNKTVAYHNEESTNIISSKEEEQNLQVSLNNSEYNTTSDNKDFQIEEHKEKKTKKPNEDITKGKEGKKSKKTKKKNEIKGLTPKKF